MSTAVGTLSPASSVFTEDKSTLRRVILSCMIGNALEWYDFALYGYFATIIGQLFFPSASVFASLMATFGVFAAGFIMRPLGGIIFGHIGDKIGRKDALLWSIYLMALPTALIGLLPTYEQIGWMAPVLLTVIRLSQGLSMGGEFTGSMVFVVEHAPDHKRGLFGSWVVFSLVIGILVGSSVATATCYLLNEEQLHSWGWRVPFLLSVLGGLVGSYMRNAVDEPEQFKAAKKQHKTEATPLKQVFQHHLKGIGLVMMIDLTVAIGFYIIVTFIPNYMSALLGWEKSESLLITTVSMIAMGAVIPFCGFFSDKFGRKPVLMAGALMFIFGAYPLFETLEMSGLMHALFAQIGLAMIMGTYFAPIPATLMELFPTEVRYSALSIAHSLAMAIFGGSAPLVATWLIHVTDNYSAPALYLALAAFISLIFVWKMPEHARDHLE
ncbi:MFS transporter [Candidatus Bealeia paramacronuclearis]|uniref:MFS transporter n=1 Tax=Candidatus Bealeia paramacronuclearis TaxID=1921001 RepID=A0ABZ2C454_9PROT|nr:MFS transporter [Candidatus Bealeia paramacronuclearis]